MKYTTWLYLNRMPCPRCGTKDLKLSSNDTLYCESKGHRITPEERFLFLETWVEDLFEIGGRDDKKVPREVTWGGNGWVFK